MAVFAIIAQPQLGTANMLPAAVAAVFPNDFLAVAGNVWLVAHFGTAQDLSGKLGITEGTNGTAIVVEVGSYFGRADPNIWTWIKAKMEAPNGGQAAQKL